VGEAELDAADLVELGEILASQLQAERPEVVLELLAAASPEDGDDHRPRLLGSHPGDGDLCRGGIVLGGDLVDRVRDGQGPMAEDLLGAVGGDAASKRVPAVGPCRSVP
jgi:hypothetical protein